MVRDQLSKVVALTIQGKVLEESFALNKLHLRVVATVLVFGSVVNYFLKLLHNGDVVQVKLLNNLPQFIFFGAQPL